MEIKGTAVKITQEFVIEKYPVKYNVWLESLPENSKILFNKGILASNWYSLIDAVLVPTEKVAEICYNNDIKKAAFEVGFYSAIKALSGVYKIFVKIAALDFVLKRTKSIFSTYYLNGSFDMISSDDNKVEFIAKGFTKGEELIFERIAGWVSGIFSVVSNKKYIVNYKIFNDGAEKIGAEITTNWI